MREIFSSGSPWEDKVGYSRAVKVGNVIEVSGTTATIGGVVQSIGDSHGQTIVALTIIQEAIESLGGTLNDVVRTRVYCTNIEDWQKIGDAHASFFGTIKPAMTLVEISKLIHPDHLIEIEATARLK
jgi:enamine deaminase RidA (YjgF/YER057c/UK114 family)